MHRRAALTLGLGAMGATLGRPFAAAQSSGGVIKIVFPLGAGAAGDVLTRLMAEGIATATGRPVIVENRTGAEGMLAVSAVKSAAANGDTLLANTGPPMWMRPLITDTPGFDPFKDFMPVAIYGHFDFCIAVANNTEATTMAELVAWLKAHPQQRTYAVLGLASIQNFAGSRLAKLADVEMLHVLYKGGAQAISDLIAGHIPVYISGVGDAVEQHKAGKLRVVAVAGKVRSPFLPDVPTARESGFDLVAQSWYGLWAPAGTPPQVVKQLNAAIVAQMQTPEARARIAIIGYLPGGGTPEDMAADMQAQAAAWAPVIKDTGFRLER